MQFSEHLAGSGWGAEMVEKGKRIRGRAAQILSEIYLTQKMIGMHKFLVETSDRWNLGHFFRVMSIHGARTPGHRGGCKILSS